MKSLVAFSVEYKIFWTSHVLIHISCFRVHTLEVDTCTNIARKPAIFCQIRKLENTSYSFFTYIVWYIQGIVVVDNEFTDFVQNFNLALALHKIVTAVLLDKCSFWFLCKFISIYYCLTTWGVVKVSFNLQYSWKGACLNRYDATGLRYASGNT